MSEDTKSASAIPTLEDWQHWTLVMGRAQQMMMEFWAQQMKQGQAMPSWSHSSLPPAFGFGEQGGASDPMAISLEPFERQFLDFADAIAKGRKPLVAGEEGYQALELVDAVYRSCRSGDKVVLGAEGARQ